MTAILLDPPQAGNRLVAAMTGEGLRLFFPLAALHAALWPLLWVFFWSFGLPLASETRRLYVNGKTGYLDSLDAERVLASADTALAASDSIIVADQMALFLALGGGWSTEATAAPH